MQYLSEGEGVPSLSWFEPLGLVGPRTGIIPGWVSGRLIRGVRAEDVIDGMQFHFYE